MGKRKPKSRRLEIDNSLLKLYDATPLPMILSRIDGTFEYVNPALLNLLGYPEEKIYEPTLIITHPDDIHLNITIRDQLKLDPLSPVVVEKRYLHKSGESLVVILTIVAQTDSEDNIIRYIAQIVDITDRKRIEEQLMLASLVYKTSSEGMMITDADGIIKDINNAFTGITGYTRQDVVGKNAHNALYSGVKHTDYYQSILRQLELTGSWKGEIWNKRKNGEIYPGLLSVNSDIFEDGSVNKRIALYTDLTQMKANEALIHQQAFYDSLTNLPNRNMFFDQLEQAMRKSDKEDLPLAVLILDLDGFKEVNDLLGHDTGDQLLKNTARRLVECLSDTDIVARLGGDEFAIIVTGIQDIRAIDIELEEILTTLSNPFEIANEQIYISASIGITLYPEDSDSLSELLKNADQAMYSAKQQGRDRYCYFTKSLQVKSLTRSKVISDLRAAVDNQQFVLHYQPIVNLTTNEISKAEALVRWQHPENGIINPDEFIKIAEETGLILGVGNWVINEALHQAATWRKTLREDFQISINKSPLQFKSENYKSDEWLALMDGLGLHGSAIVIEITENVLMDVSNSLDAQLQELMNANIKFSLDDFGTGYSSLSYLKRFNFDYLKIDRSYIQNLAGDTDEYLLCESIIQMAHKLGIEVVAEGIETEEQLKILKSAGCDYGQGFLFSKPLPASQFDQLILQSTLQ